MAKLTHGAVRRLVGGESKKGFVRTIHKSYIRASARRSKKDSTKKHALGEDKPNLIKTISTGNFVVLLFWIWYILALLVDRVNANPVQDISQVNFND